MLLISSVSTAQAQDDGERWGSSVWTNGSCSGGSKSNFDVGDTVYFKGSDFYSGQTYNYIVKIKNGAQVSSGSLTTNSGGNFCVSIGSFSSANTYQAVLTASYGWTYTAEFRVIEQPSFSHSIGACSWTEQGGSTRPVTLTLTGGASVRISGPGGYDHTFTSSQTITLAAGHYTYRWFENDRCHHDGSFDVAPCTPASASAVPGGCQWSEQTGATTPVVITVSNASLTIAGVGTFTTNTTLNLGPGTYSYSWNANPGYSGSGADSFTLIDCTPSFGTASIDAGACVWDESKGSTFTATITLDNASLTINGVTYVESTEIELPCGTYPYTWTANSGYQGGGSGSIDVEGCEPAKVDVIVGACDWTGASSMTPVTLNITGATLVLYETTSGSPVELDTYGPGSHSVSLGTGTFSYAWEANEDFEGSGSGTFETLDCEPGKADASVNIGACAFDEGKSLTLVSINVNGAVLTIDGEEYEENAEVKLEPGDYPYSWEAVTGYEGSGSGTIHVEGCEPASVEVILGACDWLDATSITPVTLNINGATLTLFVDNDGTLTEIDEYGPGSHTVSLPMGSYAYSWVANEDFTGSGEGTFETLDCEPGKADASIILGACTYDNEQSLTLVSVFLNGAVLTIDGQEFFENAELKLAPGEYAYSWVAASKEFEGSGEGVLVVAACDPKGGEDPSPDVAAGGSGPSLIVTLTPALLTVAGVAIAWVLIKHRIKNI